jgi:carotenoid cleavage dioxygenase-like enzyme
MGTARASEELPFHLRGNFAPVREEKTAFNLEVHGAIPPELRGLCLRNGPNPRSGSSPHWFFGDGMVHGVALSDGEAKWYRNRWVRTRPYLEGDETAILVRPDGSVDPTVAKANTHIVGHAGRLLALVESSFPTEMTRELETVGIYDYCGKLATAMTAHPKLCPVTGEMHFFGYGFSPPFLTYHRANAAGELVQSEVIEVPGPTMMHDFAITERHVIFMDLPVVFDAERAMQGTMPYAWSDDYGARLGIMPRGGEGADVRWFEIEPCYVFHPFNAYEDGNEVVLDVARYPEIWRNSPADFDRACLHRFRVDLGSGKVREEGLDDLCIEFPRVDPRCEGRAHRFGYAVSYDFLTSQSTGALVQYDLAKGKAKTHEFGPGRVPGEGVFVPASAGAAEDEGWVMSYVYDEARDASALVVLDAAGFDKPPVASVALPQRVPFGFHGNWIPDSA